MTVRCWETQKSRQFSGDAKARKGSWEFVVTGVPVLTGRAGDEEGDPGPAPASAPAGRAAVVAAVEARCPAAWAGMFRGEIDCVPQGGGVWAATAAYARDAESAPDPGGGAGVPVEPQDKVDPFSSFDIRGETAHVQQSLKTYSKTGEAGWTPVDYRQAIGVGPDGKAEGVDALAPAQERTITRTFAARQVTEAYLRRLELLVGRTNLSAWGPYGFSEARFMGATGAFGADGRWSIAFKIAVSRGVEGVVIRAAVAAVPALSAGDPGLVVAEKPGWHYIWCDYRPRVVDGRLVDVPVAAYVEQVFPLGDFADLGIDPPAAIPEPTPPDPPPTTPEPTPPAPPPAPPPVPPPPSSGGP